MTPSVTDDQIATALRSFLLVCCPSLEVVQGQDNRVPEPAGPDHIVFTSNGASQLSTTIHIPDPVAAIIQRGRQTSISVQIDVYGPNSQDNAQVITTLFRDSYGCEAMAGTDVQPLYCNDGTQMPLVNGEEQYEFRWMIRAVLQVLPFISTPAEFADNVVVSPVEAD